MLKRKAIPPKTQKKLRTKNLGVCCVCKERSIGTNFHHIDDNPANNDEGNIAVLCVKEHDQHHRPKSYDQTKHLELGADKIREYKREWEQTVEECNSNNPKILAVVNVYGDYTNIHSVRLLVQNVNSKIIYQRIYHLLTGTPDQWTDAIIDEVLWLGKNVKLSLIDKPLQVEYCPCCSTSLSNTLDRNVAIHLTVSDWKQKSIASIYINPPFPSLALTLFYGDEPLYKAHLHKCKEKHLHFLTDKFEERTPIKKYQSIRTQATEIMQKVVDTWNPGQLLIGTGNPDKPTIIKNFNLPDIWEKKNSR
ncbi:MAG: HNH endonuclease [Nitrospinae bacterium]|nr:HNH endonuclease [Nitrospinota bacterium]